MRKRFKYFPAWLLSLLCLLGAKPRSVQTESIYWQKLRLEETLKNSVKEALTPVLTKDQFSIRSEVIIKQPSPLDLIDSQKEELDREREKRKSEREARQNKENSGQPDENSSNQNQGPGVKVSDIAFDEAKPDYIAFSKVGLEVPVLKNYLDLVSKDKSTDVVKNAELARKKLQSQAEDDDLKLDEERRYFEYLYQFNKVFDVFELVKSASIEVFIDKDLPQITQKTVKDILKKLKFNVGGVIPSVKVTTMSFKQEEKTKEEVKPKALSDYNLEDYINLLSRFSNLIGLLLSTLIVGFIAFVLLRMYISFKKNHKEEGGGGANPPAPAPPPEKEKEEIPPPAALGGGEAGEDDGLAEKEQGVDRLLLFYKSSPEEAQVLLQRWISSDAMNSREALTAIAQQASSDDLSPVFKALGKSDRQKWKDNLLPFLDKAGLKRANLFISREIVSDMIVPGAISDPELIAIIVEMSPESGVKFIQENRAYAKVFLNLINPQYSSKILELLDEKMSSEVLTEAIECNLEEVKDQLDEFKEKIRTYRSSQKVFPFASNIVEMISKIDPSKEGPLFTALGKTGDSKLIKETLFNYFPTSQLFELPDKFLRAALQNYPIHEKVRLLVSQDEGMKNKLLGIFAEPGSTARELIDMEMKQIEESTSDMEAIAEEKSEIFQKFMSYIRDLVKNDEMNRSEIQKVIESYSETIFSSSANAA